MILKILDTETRKKRIFATPSHPSFWKEERGAYDRERARLFGIKPVKGWPEENIAERYLIIEVDDTPIKINDWNKFYPPEVITRALLST